MSTRSQRAPSIRANVPGRLARFLAAALGPSDRIGDVGQRRRARWLAGLLVLMITAFGALDAYYLVTRPEYVPPWYGYLFLGTSYALVRTGRYTAGALLTLAMIPVVVFALVGSGASASPMTTLSFLVLGIMLASVLLSLQAVIALTLIDTIGVIALAEVRGASQTGTFVGPLVLVVISGGIACVGAMLRERIEQDRREALLQANLTLEDRVRARTQELERANDELEAFAYSASHDLRTPLRAIDAYAAMLAEDTGSPIDARSRDLLMKIRSSTRRMTDLVDGMLELAKVSRAVVRVEPLDLASLAREVVQELRAAEPHHPVTFVCPDELPVKGDRALVRMALTNLIHNAWKFTRGKETPRIELGSEPKSESDVCYFVKDNGIGFDPALVGKLFEPFQRLHANDVHGGTGIGTTIVARSIERQGGRVWADGQEGRGAVFRFTLGGP
ncbi:MAG TPA: ATP-binding protein [Polyangiaceae bacterium]